MTPLSVLVSSVVLTTVSCTARCNFLNWYINYWDESWEIVANISQLQLCTLVMLIYLVSVILVAVVILLILVLDQSIIPEYNDDYTKEFLYLHYVALFSRL